jgi:hypothetical protein
MCYCGDSACWSCGPAQGYDPAMEAACEQLLKEIPSLADADEAAEGAITVALVEKIDAADRAARESAARLVETRLANLALDAASRKAVAKLVYEIRTGEIPWDPEEEAQHERDYSDWLDEREREALAYQMEHQADVE